MKKAGLAPGIVSIFLGGTIALSGIIFGIISTIKNLYGELHAFVFPSDEVVWAFFGLYILLYGIKTLNKRIKHNKRAEKNTYF